MKNKKTLEQEINEFLEVWGADEMVSFIEDSAEVIAIYDVPDEKQICDEYQITLRSIRTVEHISYMSHKYSAVMSKIRVMFPRLYERLHMVSDDSRGCSKIQGFESLIK